MHRLWPYPLWLLYRRCRLGLVAWRSLSEGQKGKDASDVESTVLWVGDSWKKLTESQARSPPHCDLTEQQTLMAASGFCWIEPALSIVRGKGKGFQAHPMGCHILPLQLVPPPSTQGTKLNKMWVSKAKVFGVSNRFTHPLIHCSFIHLLN